MEGTVLVNENDLHEYEDHIPSKIEGADPPPKQHKNLILKSRANDPIINSTTISKMWVISLQGTIDVIRKTTKSAMS